MAGMDDYGGGYTILNGTTSTSTTDIVWPNWVQGMVGSPLTGTGASVYWDNGTVAQGTADAVQCVGLGGTGQSWTVRYVRPDETLEEREARDAEVVRLQGAVKRNEEHKAAMERAERLLVEHLSPAQRAAYERDRFFEVVAAKSRYRIYHDGAVRRLGEDGREVATYCIHPDEAIPAGDLALAKKLLIEADEAAFRRIANESLIGIAVNA